MTTKSLNKIVVPALLSFFAIGFFYAPTANAGLKEKIVEHVLKYAKNQEKLHQICRKGSGFSTISIRSGGGAVCKIPMVAALAEIICGGGKDVEGYESSKGGGSGCHQKAVAALGGVEPHEFIKSKLSGKDKEAFDRACADGADFCLREAPPAAPNDNPEPQNNAGEEPNTEE